jgi:menaquinone-dependent protoporphyrinogen IX oxidase
VLKELLVGLGVLVLISALTGVYIINRAMQETVTDLKTINPESSGPKAIVIFSPGVSDYHQKVTESFASGLVSSGWRVDIVTASSQTLTDLTGYSLLVIGGPIHGALPSKPVKDYMSKVNSLKGIRVFAVLSSLGGKQQGEQYISDWVTKLDGVGVGALSLSTGSPNVSVDGTTDPVQIAFKVAEKIPK